MNIQEAKGIRLVDFLAGLGHNPVVQRGNSVWYKSPFRTEKKASFKVDFQKELWYDFGLGRGGDIISLGKEIYQTDDVSHVLRCFENKRIVLKPIAISCPVEEVRPVFQELKIRPLANRILLAYLKERCVNMGTAKEICREAYFKRNGKNYFAIAFPNVSGGYEVRNRYFKACIAPKDITHIIRGPESRKCYVFEGFMDFLSFGPAFPHLECSQPAPERGRLAQSTRQRAIFAGKKLKEWLGFSICRIQHVISIMSKFKSIQRRFFKYFPNYRISISYRKTSEGVAFRNKYMSSRQR